jgi:ribosomal protein S18 acetylase RimI-like enzyme
MTIADYDSVRELLGSVPGITVRAADSRAMTERYLSRNPGLSFVASLESRIVGCVMCGHDGRRGYLQHLAVEPGQRRRGIGAELVGRCIQTLGLLGIEKIHIDVLAENTQAQDYWTKRGWQMRGDIVRYSFTSSTDPNV